MVAHQSPNLKLLRAFSTVARCLSFSRAAAELGRSQATLSVQVRELERQLNVSLLQRTTRRVSLTEAGAKLAETLDVGFAAIDAGLAAVRDWGDTRRRRIVLACVPSISSTRLPPILAHFRSRDRKTRIEVEELTSKEIFAALIAGTIDFGIGPCPIPAPMDISFSPAVDDPLYAVVPAGSRYGKREGIDFETLNRYGLITLSGSVLLTGMLEQAAGAHGVALSTRTEVRHVQTALAMAQAGVGAAIVPKIALPGQIAEGVVALPIVDPPIIRKVGLITAAGRPLEGAAARLARYIRAALARPAEAPQVQLDDAPSAQSELEP